MINDQELLDYLAKRFVDIKGRFKTEREETQQEINTVEQGLKDALERLEAVKKEIDALKVKSEELAREIQAKEKPEPELRMIKGEPGVGIADLMINQKGELVATFDDGRMKELGRVVGERGKDGVSFESFALNWHAEIQELEVVGRANGQQKSVMIQVPLLKNKGYWRDGMKARALETYSLDGCLWIANEDTATRPGTDNKAWTLAARKGRDGKDFRDIKSEPVKL